MDLFGRVWESIGCRLAGGQPGLHGSAFSPLLIFNRMIEWCVLYVFQASEWLGVYYLPYFPSFVRQMSTITRRMRE